jgi:hypothetical protein
MPPAGDSDATASHRSAGRSDLGVAIVAMLPVVAIYLAHYLLVPAGYHGTGFLHYDQPYYMANAHATVAPVFSPVYKLPFATENSTPAIYFQPLTAVLGGMLWLTGWDPGAIYAGFGVLAGIAMFRAALAMIAAFNGRPSDTAGYLATLTMLWGGGLLAAGGWVFSPEKSLDAVSFLDPFGGFWFLNLGRNAYFPVEAFYHVLFFSAVTALIRRRFGIVLALVALTSVSHPFTGVELILVVGAFAVGETGLPSGSRVGSQLGSRVPFWFLAGIAAILAIHLSYYLVALKLLSPDHVKLEKQWLSPWLLPWPSMLFAYGPVAILAAIRLRSVPGLFGDPAQAPIRLAAVWFATAFLLANHELFVKAHQPLHFTRGYVWTPLALLAWPVLRQIYRRILHIRPALAGAALAAAVTLLACGDNIAWFGRAFYLMAAGREPNHFLLTGDERATLARLAEPDIAGRLLIGDAWTVGYLATVYVPLRAWYSHTANTPGAAEHKADIVRFLATGSEIPAWRGRDLVVVTRVPGGHDPSETLLAAGFRRAGRYGELGVFVRDAR